MTAAPAPKVATKGTKKQNQKKSSDRTKKGDEAPSTFDMIKKAIQEKKERKGTSRQGIIKFIAEAYTMKVDQRIRSLVNRVLRSNVENGKLQIDGGRFKIPKKIVSEAMRKPNVVVKKVIDKKKVKKTINKKETAKTSSKKVVKAKDVSK